MTTLLQKIQHLTRPVRIEHRLDDSNEVVGAESQQIEVASGREVRALDVEVSDLLVLRRELMF